MAFYLAQGIKNTNGSNEHFHKNDEDIQNRFLSIFQNKKISHCGDVELIKNGCNNEFDIFSIDEFDLIKHYNFYFPNCNLQYILDKIALNKNKQNFDLKKQIKSKIVAQQAILAFQNIDFKRKNKRVNNKVISG